MDSKNESRLNDEEEEEKYSYNELLNLLELAALPKQKYAFDEPLQPDSFRDHVLNSESNLTNSITLLATTNTTQKIPKKVLIKAVLLCGEHSKSELWTSSKTVDLAGKLLNEVLLKTSCSSLLNLLLKLKVDSFLLELRPKLLKHTWKNHPAAVSCFTWILFNIECPYLGDYLNIVLPTCLLLVDDHVCSYKILGLQCLEHLANNVSRAELNQYDQGVVIYNAVQHMTYLREPEIIAPLSKCLVSLLVKTERNPTTDPLKWTRLDDLLSVWLSSMLMEEKLKLREAYIESLNGVIQAMGLSSVRWSNKLLVVFSEYCEQDHTRDKSLRTICSFIKATWPRMTSNFRFIVIILMKVAINLVARNEIESSQSTLVLVKECFKALESCCNNQYNEFLNEIKLDNEMSRCYLFLTKEQN